MNRNTLRQISIIIYKLKRQFGLAGILRYPNYDTSMQHITNGTISINYTDISISRIVRLPRRNIQDFVYDLAYVAAGKNFTDGGFFDTNDRWFIIDTRDLPATYRQPNPTMEITPQCYVIVEGRQYKLYEVNLAEHNAAYLLRGREIVGSDTVS